MSNRSHPSRASLCCGTFGLLSLALLLAAAGRADAQKKMAKTAFSADEVMVPMNQRFFGSLNGSAEYWRLICSSRYSSR